MPITDINIGGGGAQGTWGYPSNGGYLWVQPSKKTLAETLATKA